MEWERLLAKHGEHMKILKKNTMIELSKNLKELDVTEIKDINGGKKEYLLMMAAAFPLIGLGSFVCLGIYNGYNS
jgi:hypothetical protein